MINNEIKIEIVKNEIKFIKILKIIHTIIKYLYNVLGKYLGGKKLWKK